MVIIGRALVTCSWLMEAGMVTLLSATVHSSTPLKGTLGTYIIHVVPTRYMYVQYVGTILAVTKICHCPAVYLWDSLPALLVPCFLAESQWLEESNGQPH